MGQRDDLVAASTGRGCDVAAEHPAGAGDQDAHQGTAISELSPTMKR